MAKTDKKSKKDKKDVTKKSDLIKGKPAVPSSKEILAKAAALAKSTGSKKLRTNGKKSSDSSSAEESSSEESDSSEVVSPPVKPIPSSVKKTAGSSDDSADASSSEESSSEEGDTSNKGKVSAPLKTTPAAVQKVASASDSSSSASSEDSDNDKEMASVPAKTSPGKGKKALDSDDSSNESSSEKSSSDEEMDDKTSAPAQIAPIETYKKRKADSEAVAGPKKVKLADGGAGSVSSEETRGIFVGQLSWNVDNDWLAQEFAECGQVESARVQMDRNTGRSRGFGYVNFKTVDAVEKALALDGKEIDGRAVRIDKSIPQDKKTSMDNRAQAFGDVTSPPSAVLFVGNLSFGVNEDTLWETFGDHGDIKSVRVPTDRDSGKPKGFAYVEFSDVGSAKKAHGSLQGVQLDGRSIRLDYSQPRDNAGGRGGGQVR
ncbi:hypothetical protein JVT61DRAFT_3761 [Boletus reticuloceps]|uniref:RRM domain-containing protein n=1 Tax=Boletus reticuloceps TaxID=495285 RepID=A0A8I3A7V8_9AGAM|nr:hypothetical protein JVT61DRAFT_3761 [Boletus reticuloceps]